MGTADSIGHLTAEEPAEWPRSPRQAYNGSMASGPSVQLPLTTLPLNTMTPYLRAHVEVVDDAVHWDSWWTVLGFVPVRRERLVAPLAEVVATRSRVGIHWDRLVVGVALLASVRVLPLAWMSILALGGAGLLLVMAPTAQLRVTRKDARARRLSVCILHKLDVDLIAMALDDLAGRGVPRTRTRTPRADPPDVGPLTT